jgi:hypothetical protein
MYRVQVLCSVTTIFPKVEEPPTRLFDCNLQLLSCKLVRKSSDARGKLLARGPRNVAFQKGIKDESGAPHIPGEASSSGFRSLLFRIGASFLGEREREREREHLEEPPLSRAFPSLSWFRFPLFQTAPTLLRSCYD